MELLKRTTVALAAVATLGLAVPAHQARADILPAVGTPAVVNLGGGLWRYDYEILLSNTQNLFTTDFFTIYDFGPSSAVVTPPGGWVATSDAFNPVTVSGTNGSVTPIQTAALNYTFTWTGATVLGSPTSSTSLGIFSITTDRGPNLVSSAFTGRGTDQQTSLKNANITNTL